MLRKRPPPTPDDASGSHATADALRRQARALVDADRRKDDFIAMLAHELRSPLAAIRNALETLRRRRAAAGAASEPELLIIDRQLDHLARLADDLLDVARITRGLVELRREHLELSAIVAMAVEAVEPALRTQRQRLEISLSEPPVAIDGDPVRLAQVLSNLLGNASKYSEPGSTIALTAVYEGRIVTVRVRDEGIGIPRERLDGLFDPVDPMMASRDRAQGGLGLGLTLVKALTELHGGSVEAESEGLGQGSVFTVRLPATPLAAMAEVTEAAEDGGMEAPVSTGERRESPREGDAAPRRRVLVVEDSIETAESFAELLRLAGHQVTAVRDGAAALEAALDLRPEVVFLDIGLPGMTGQEVASRLAGLPGQRPLLVAVTGYDQEEGRQQAGEALFDRFLLKPVDIREVHGILEEPPSPRPAK